MDNFGEEEPHTTKATAALDLIVAARVARAKSVKNPSAYRRKVREAVVAELGPRAAGLADQFPDAPAEVLAGHLEGEPSSLGRFARRNDTRVILGGDGFADLRSKAPRSPSKPFLATGPHTGTETGAKP